MKFIILLASIVTALNLASCSKAADENLNVSAWKEVAYYISPGTSEVHWNTTEAAAAELIEFREANVFYSTHHPQFDRYYFQAAASGANYLKVYKAGGTDTTTWFVKQVSENHLEIGYQCIEGCGKKFVRKESNQ